MGFFNLQEKETIVEEIKPLPKLKWYFFFSLGGLSSMGVFFIALLIVFTFEFPTIFFSSAGWLFLWVSIILTLILNLIFSFMRYGKQNYWITNKRIVYKRGLIGYRITSIPYERVADIIISRTFLESIFGFGSLHIQSLAGQASGTTALGSEGDLLALPDPEGTQEKIFKLAKLKRKEEGLAF